MLRPFPSPLIAQVHTPTGATWYIAQARSHTLGFVVQRQYHEVNALRLLQKKKVWIEDVGPNLSAILVPFLNPAAVHAAGLEMADVEQWARAHPEEIFTHPIYASLCLQWGKNLHGYTVEALPEVLLTPTALPFTPHTCWQSGITYYQLIEVPSIPYPREEEYVEFITQLCEQAGLKEHQYEIGAEGQWRGWYTTDRPAMERVLAPKGRLFVLAQPQYHYGVWLQYDSGDSSRIPIKLYATAEEARELSYALYELGGSPDRSTYPKLTAGRIVQWPGEAWERWTLLNDYHVNEDFARAVQQVQNVPITAAKDYPIFHGWLAEPDEMLLRAAPTLAGMLTATGIPGQQLSIALSWLMDKIKEREQNPASLTLNDLEQLATLTKRPIGQLTTLLSHEVQLRAIAAEEQRHRQALPRVPSCLDDL